MSTGKIPLGSTSCFGACEVGSTGVCKGHFGFRGAQRPPAPHTLLFTAPEASSRPAKLPNLLCQANRMDAVSAHQRPPRTRRAFLLGKRSEHHAGMRQTSVQGPKGCVYSVQYKHTSLGSGVLRRNALSHFVEINTKFMLSQIWVRLAHIRPTISAASTLLQGPGGVGIHPSAPVSGAAGESQRRAWVSVPCMGICALGASGLGSIPAPQAGGPGPRLEQEEQPPSSAFVGAV